MPEIKFTNLRVDFWEDELGEKIISRPLISKEVNMAHDVIHDLLFGDKGDPVEEWERLYREIAPDDPRWGEINWDENIIYDTK